VRTLFGALARSPAAWVEEVVGRLIESGELEQVESAPSGGGSASATTRTRLRLSTWGRTQLRSLQSLSADVLPHPLCLGAHPEQERRLWDLRRRLAEDEERAPYGIFSNRTLAELAAKRPRDLAELAEIPGFGEARIRKYGREVLEVLRGEG
jgi:ATP-dependent DNA helicase RecQ